VSKLEYFENALIHIASWSHWPNKSVFSDCLKRLSDKFFWANSAFHPFGIGKPCICMHCGGGISTAQAVWGPSADSCRHEVQVHWRLCRRSWCASDWREAYEIQSSAVFLGERRWRGSNRQPGSWERAQMAPGAWRRVTTLNSTRCRNGSHCSWRRT